MRGFFVAGTDTGVGKTQVARALCTLLLQRGLRPTPLKPVETGCAPDSPEDAIALRAACGGSWSFDQICPYRFRLPAAPLVAAEAEGRSIDLAHLESIAAAAPSPLIVEAAGGLIVPLARSSSGEKVLTNLDFAERLKLPVILVGRAGLGTLNHCALSAAALVQRGLQIAAIVLNRVGSEDDPTVATNPDWVAKLTGALVIGPLPFVADAAVRPQAFAAFLGQLTFVDTPDTRR